MFPHESHWMNSLLKGRDQQALSSGQSVAARLLSCVMKRFSVNVDKGPTKSTSVRTAFSLPMREIFHCSPHLSVATCPRCLFREIICWTGGRPETITSLEPILGFWWQLELSTLKQFRKNKKLMTYK